MNINKDEYNRLQTFQNNMKSKFGNHAVLHNIYQIKTEDMSGNVNEFYGMNVMTNYFFATVYGNRRLFDKRAIQYPSIYIGNGIDVSHQPSITNNSMFNNFTTSILSNVCHNDDYGGVYHSDTGYYVKTILIHQSVYDYNINQITSDFTANEVGWGTEPTKLFSHSKIYDINGNETTFTKRINEKTTITLYLTMACHYSLFESLWSNGSYGAIDIKHLFGMNYYNANNASFRETPALYKSLHRSYTMEAGYSSSDANLGRAFIVPYTLEQPSAYETNLVNFTVTYDETNHTGTYETNNVVTYLIDSKYHQFANFVIDSLEYNGYRPSQDAYLLQDTDFLFVKPYKTSTKESVTTFIKTDWWNNNYLYDILGFNRYADAKYGYGFLPVLDMDIRSVYRYNYLTDDYDIAESFTNKPDNDYNMFNWMYCCCEHIVYPDGVARNAYIYCNPHYQDRAVLGFDEGGYTMYCTDTWWDVSTWELVENTKTLTVSQRNKKYYILDRFLNGGYGYDKTNLRLYDNENSNVRKFLKPRIFTDSDKSAIDYEFTPYKHTTYTTDEGGYLYISPAGANTIPFIVDDTHDLFVLNNHIIHKVSEGIDVNTVRYMYENPSTVLTPNFETLVTAGWTVNNRAGLTIPFYTENSRQIFMVASHTEKYGYNTYNTIYENHPIFFMADMTLPAADIGPGIEFINISSFTEATANNTLSNYAALSVGKYLCFKGSTSSGSEVVIYDTENHTETLLPFKTNTWRRLYGTNCLIFDPSNDLDHWTIYDVSTQTITHEFDLPNDYVSQTMFMGFDEFVYILCKIGNDYSLLLHDITKDTTQQITYPETWFIDGRYDWNASIPYGFNGAGAIEYNSREGVYSFNPYNTYTLSSNQVYGSMSSMDHVYQRVSYKDGILVTSNTHNNARNHIFVFTRNDATSIITQSIYNISDYQRYKCPYITYSHNNYWLFLSMTSGYDSSNWSTTQTIIVNLGKIVNNHGPITTSTIDSDYYSLMFNRIYRDNYDGEYTTRLLIPFDDKIYYVNGSTRDIYVYPYTTFIEHKITFETNTCVPINNPKLITLPNLRITMSNVAPVS